MIIIKNLKILKLLVILLYNQLKFFKLINIKTILDKYLYLISLNIKAIINFKVLIKEKFKFEYFIIFYILISKYF